MGLCGETKKKKSCKTIIIPKGIINPNEQTVIEIPTYLDTNSSLVVKAPTDPNSNLTVEPYSRAMEYNQSESFYFAPPPAPAPVPIPAPAPVPVPAPAPAPPCARPTVCASSSTPNISVPTPIANSTPIEPPCFSPRPPCAGPQPDKATQNTPSKTCYQTAEGTASKSCYQTAEGTPVPPTTPPCAVNPRVALPSGSGAQNTSAAPAKPVQYPSSSTTYKPPPSVPCDQLRTNYQNLHSPVCPITTYSSSPYSSAYPRNYNYPSCYQPPAVDPTPECYRNVAGSYQPYSTRYTENFNRNLPCSPRLDLRATKSEKLSNNDGENAALNRMLDEKLDKILKPILLTLAKTYAADDEREISSGSSFGCLNPKYSPPRKRFPMCSSFDKMMKKWSASMDLDSSSFDPCKRCKEDELDGYDKYNKYDRYSKRTPSKSSDYDVLKKRKSNTCTPTSGCPYKKQNVNFDDDLDDYSMNVQLSESSFDKLDLPRRDTDFGRRRSR